jgi:lysosomal Pro-X carboxypeptidase
MRTAPPRPSTANCRLQWFDQLADHFNFDNYAAVFLQRYYVCDDPAAAWRPNQTILFYTGNEASVEIYVNSTGFAWEHAAELGARIVFMEHRFYGESLIPGAGDASGGDLHLLTMEQALADYARAIYLLKQEWNSAGSPVIALGGSYGGMLSAWLRMKYPGAVQGALAASAPILAFDGLGQFARGGGLEGFKVWDSNAYWRVVTRDATPAAGAVDGCVVALARPARGRTVCICVR